MLRPINMIKTIKVTVNTITHAVFSVVNSSLHIVIESITGSLKSVDIMAIIH